LFVARLVGVARLIDTCRTIVVAVYAQQGWRILCKGEQVASGGVLWEQELFVAWAIGPARWHEQQFL
jgi:hypothetical protein